MTGTALNNAIFVSIIVPVYNGGHQLDQCLSAMRRSLYANYELIVVDNGSTDDSVEIARKYGTDIVYCPGPSGPGAARNAGVSQARGDIVFFVDADVVIYPQTLSRVVADFQASPDLAAVFGSYDDSPSGQNFLSQYKNLFHHYVHQQGNSVATTFWAGCGAIRKEIFHKVGGFDQDKYPHPSIEDIELGCRIYQLGYRILLDKNLQAKHLKVWRFGSLLRADILYRARPWSQLILEKQGLVNDLNLQTSQRISAAVVVLIIVLFILMFVQPFLAYGIIFLLGLFVMLNRSLFGFFLRRRGLGFVALVLPIHALYFLYSSVTFAFCCAQHIVCRRKRLSNERRKVAI